ncbi:DUF4105 domain-containing protein [Candidatus Daviesbacteria bacterium]|nr:DUF4105 domain-containing protein [Candidatus Daviesbacteria bacterium]
MKKKVPLSSKYLKKLFVCLLLILTAWLIYLFFVLQPSNNRDWEFGQKTLPSIQINNNIVKVQNIRDFHFKPKEIASTNYINKTVDINNIDKVWFLVEPFGKFKAVAHTYFVFDFKNESPLAVSVEARREKGEKYDAFIGAFNQYELIYIWSTESDETIRRVIYEDNKLYMYPLKISSNGAKQLFLQLAEQTHSLETKPRFYNTLTSNCTNELAKSASRVKPNAVPLNLALFMPGYSVNELYKLGYLPNNIPLEQLPEKYYVSDFVKRNYDQVDFTNKLRTFLSD